MYKSIWFKTVATGNVSRRAVIIDGLFVPRCQAKASHVSGGKLISEVGAGSGTAGAEVDIESTGIQSLDEAAGVSRGFNGMKPSWRTSMSDASNSPQAHMRVHIHGSWAWRRR